MGLESGGPDVSPDLRDKLKLLADCLVATAIILLMVVVAGCAILLSGCGVAGNEPFKPATMSGKGTWVVGPGALDDIPAGTYMLDSAQADCLWWVRDVRGQIMQSGSTGIKRLILDTGDQLQVNGYCGTWRRVA